MNVISFKEAKCKNCYKCVRNCEVKAITVKDSQAYIMNDNCILCGHCLEICPQNAKSFISDLERVKTYLKNKIPTIISLAPSYLGVLKYETSGQVITALRKLGFSAVSETAEGAAYVTREYQHLLKEGTMTNIITTCCPSVNDLIEIYYPSLTKYMAPVISPMIAHGKILRKKYGKDVKIVFLGPCIAKKREAESDPRTTEVIDAVINFKELEEWLEDEHIDLTTLSNTLPDNPDPLVNRLYPISSGVLSSVLASNDKTDNYRKFYVHGIRNCIDLLESMQQGEISGCFIEANICNGGCIKGSALDRANISRFKVKLDLEETIDKKPVQEEAFYLETPISLSKTFFDRKPKDKIPAEDQIRNILSKIGKTKPEDMLNCGACGYASCRDKAIAVYQGKAELSMCIPYMHERAQSMSNFVLDTTPNIILIVDAEMKIMEFSRAAEKFFDIPRSKAKEMYLYELIDHSNFQSVMDTHKDIVSKKVVYPELNYTSLQTIVYMEEQNCVLGIFQDISNEEEQSQKAYKMKVETIEMAQRVIDKQMMVAQEIAGLLGETTAETKVTLTKLRDTILNDGKPYDTHS